MANPQVTCGSLKAVTDEGSDVKFTGQLALHGVLAGSISLALNPRFTQGSDAPNYEVFHRDALGAVYAIGAAWVKNSDKVRQGDFLSITLASPAIDPAVNLSAFPPEDKSGMWRIVWRRERQLAAAA